MNESQIERKINECYTLLDQNEEYLEQEKRCCNLIREIRKNLPPDKTNLINAFEDENTKSTLMRDKTLIKTLIK